MRAILTLWLFFFCTIIFAQQFQNPDLEGEVGYDEYSLIPEYWESVPGIHPWCLATHFGISDTPDLTGIDGPFPPNGTYGNAYSGNTFVSGMYLNSGNGNTVYHEGIMQAVDGFEVDSSYCITFYQAVIKQEQVTDEVGQWKVYRAGYAIPLLSEPSYSGEAYDSPDHPWEYRVLTFRATANSHTFLFFPQDDDPLSLINGVTPDDEGIRMGIDSIFLRPTCYLSQTLEDEVLLCNTDSITLSVASPNASYLWQDGSTASTFTATEGEYSVIIRGENGCIAKEDVSVRKSEVEDLDLGADTTLCLDSTISLLPLLTGVNYLWSTGFIGNSLTVDTAGIYWLKVSDNDCIKRDTIIINDNPINSLSLGIDTLLCPGDNLILQSPSLPNASYTWQDGSDEALYTTSETGMYWVEGMLDGCIVRDSIIVYDAFPDFSLGADTVICTGESLLLDVTLPNTTYLWQDGSTTPTFLATSGGTYTVALSRGNCTISDTLEVTELSFGALDLGADTTLCPGSSLTLTAEIPGANYIWQDQSTDADFTLSAPGFYWVTASLGDCAATDSILVSPHPLNPVDLGEEQTICAGGTLLLNAAQNGASYSWQDGSSSSSYEVTAPGNYSVTVSLDECSSSDDVQVVNSLLQPLDLGPDLTLCQGESFTLSGPPEAESYNWSNGANTESVTISTAGTYRLIATLGECTEEDEFVLSYNPLAPFSLGVDTTLCLGDSLQLVAANTMAEILWSDGTTEDAIWVDTPGNYELTLTLDGCIQNSSLLVDYYEATSLELGEDITICKTQPLVLTPEITGPPATFLWQDGTSSPSYDVQNSGTYSLTLTNICETVTDEINITVEECTCEVYLPNAFSPNGDNKNDTFQPYTTCPITDYEIQIFDRWGGLRYTSNTIEDGWQGLEVNSGVYLYTLRYRDRDGQWQQRAGEVHLVR